VINRFRASVLVAVPILLAGTAVGAAPSALAHGSAKRPVETFLFSNAQALTSSTGIRLQTSVSADAFSSGGADASIELFRRGESHNWDLPVGRRTFSFSHQSGRGSLVTGTQLGRLGELTLTLSRRGPTRTKTCAGGNVRQRTPVTVSGSLTVDPRSATWGRIGSAAHPQTFTAAALVETDHGRAESGCFNGTSHPSCPAQRDWNGPSSQSVFLSGGWVRRHGTRHGFVEAERTVEIGDTQGFRDDSIERAAPAPTFASRHGAVLVRVTAHGVAGASGSATLRSVGSRSTRSFGCGHHKVVQDRTWSASYTNGRTPLTIASAVGRAIREHDSKRGSGIDFMSAAVTGTPSAADGSRVAIRPSSRPGHDSGVTMDR
jgi:hypothetical protein